MRPLRRALPLLTALTLGALLPLAPAAAHATPCPPRTVTPNGDLYFVDYGPGDSAIYRETGVQPGLQGGDSMDPTPLHDHRCYWPVTSQRDTVLFCTMWVNCSP